MNGSLCSCLFVVIHLKEAAGGRFFAAVLCSMDKGIKAANVPVHRFKMISQMHGKTAAREEEWI